MLLLNTWKLLRQLGNLTSRVSSQQVSSLPVASSSNDYSDPSPPSVVTSTASQASSSPGSSVASTSPSKGDASSSQVPSVASPSSSTSSIASSPSSSGLVSGSSDQAVQEGSSGGGKLGVPLEVVSNVSSRIGPSLILRSKFLPSYHQSLFLLLLLPRPQLLLTTWHRYPHRRLLLSTQIRFPRLHHLSLKLDFSPRMTTITTGSFRSTIKRRSP